MEKQECLKKLGEREPPSSKGCRGIWDNISCWDHAEVGDTVTIACPQVLRSLFGRNGNISKNCTADGWSKVFPNITSVCGSEDKQEKLIFYLVVKTLYTLGHSLSLVALTTGSAILCMFRKLHCTRNYIHLNLFFSFILRAVAVLVKDGVLFSHNSQCSEQPSLVNFVIFISIIRILVQKLRCPNLGGNNPSQYKRLAKSTLLLIPLFGVNYVVFVSLAKSMSDYKIFFDLAIGSFQGFVVAILYCFLNSELLEVVLHFVFEMIAGPSDPSLTAREPNANAPPCLEQVQGEIKRKWGSVSANCRAERDYGFRGSCVSQSGPESGQGFERHSRAQSFLQTETSVL
ncbi:vasoactive intestinal polypeptide receptor 2-like [Scleropages formosus]|uniref:Vasoactive intestinal polypeptide receptor 2-like n=1 Tax=Scleropages formosus TaxID=113540 RepID=A0A0P7UPD1_SCLFO|nr:vasoactive intestinal polypeptide receptor 2-like [Scleropages formosus]